MDPNNINPVSPVTPPSQVSVPEEKSTGPTIAIAIIVVIIIAGGYYLWKSGVLKRTTPSVAPTTEGTAASDVASIEADLGAIDIGSDSGLNQLETQF